MIKRIFILLFAAFSFFACTEDETIEIDFPELVGTWELDKTQSLFSGEYYIPGQIQSETMKFTKDGKFTLMTVYNNGSTSKSNYAYEIKNIKRDVNKITFDISKVYKGSDQKNDRFASGDGYVYWNIEDGCLNYCIIGCAVSCKCIYKKKE